MPENTATSAPYGFDAVVCRPLDAGGGYEGRTVRAALLGDQLAGIEEPVMTGRTARSAAPRVPMMVVIPTRGEARAEPMPTEEELPATLRDRIGCGLFEAIGAEVDDLVVTVWCDEEGALDPDAEMNPRIVRAFAEVDNPALPVSGVVVLTGGPDRHGNTRGLPARLAHDLTDRFNRPITGEDLFSMFKGLTHPAVRPSKPAGDATPSRDDDPFP